MTTARAERTFIRPARSQIRGGLVFICLSFRGQYNRIMDANRFLTCAEAAAILDVSSGRVRALARAGRLPGRKAGRDWIFNPAEVKKFRPGPIGNPNFGKKTA